MGELSLFLEKLLDTTARQLPWVPCVFVWYGKIYGIVVPIKSFLYKEWLDIWNTFLLPTGQDVDNQWEQEKWERTSRRGQQKHKLVKRGNISLPQKKKKISISTVSPSKLSTNTVLIGEKLVDSPAEMLKTDQIFIIKAVRQASGKETDNDNIKWYYSDTYCPALNTPVHNWMQSFFLSSPEAKIN